MKQFLLSTKVKSSFLYLAFIGTIGMVASSCKKEPTEPTLKITTFATGLSNPIGMEIDKNGKLLVAESGTGKNDGKLVMIMADGSKQDLITGFPSGLIDNGDPDGPSHLLFADGLLYILGTGGKMYKADPAMLKPGSPLKASSLGVENIGAWVLSQGYADSHPYNFIVGPNGAIFFTDAGANAIIRREKTGALSILAKIPGIANPTPVGPPQIESVPTGIYYDGKDFLVTTLLGFPFPAGKSLVYKVTAAGAVTEFQKGFTSLVDIAEGNSYGRLVLGHGTFGAMGFMKKTGTLTWVKEASTSVLTTGFNLPAGLKQVDAHTWYVTNLEDGMATGTVSKVTY